VTRRAPRIVAALVGAVLLAAAIVVVAVRAGTPAGGGASRGFEDLAKERGLDFTMAFLPGEQGERFKVNFYDHGAGVAVADVDGDGDDDLYFPNQLGPNALFVNDGHGRFTDGTARAGIALGDRVCVAAAFADADGDGDLDLYVTSTRGGNAFFRNRGDGTFEDRTAQAGLTLVAHSETPAFFDADGDGDLDLLVTNTAHWTLDTLDPSSRYYVGPATFFDLLMRSQAETNRFYRNRGDGTFEDASLGSGLEGSGWSGDVAVFDEDGDGRPDVLIANMFGRSHLYRNAGGGRFEDASDALPHPSWGTVGTCLFDADGDGRLDLLLVDMHSDMWMDPDYAVPDAEARSKFGGVWGPLVERGQRPREQEQMFARMFDAQPSRVQFGNTLFLNLSGGRWQEVSDEAGVETLWPWGAAAADFDGDGFEDLYLASGMGYPYRWAPSPVLMNRGDGTFVDRTRELGLDPPPDGPFLPQKIGGQDAARSARSVAVGDFDGDGRVDLVVNRFNDRPQLLMNRFPAKHYVKLRLRPAHGATELGALVRVTAGGRTQVRELAPTGGYLAQSSRTLHVGLGDVAKVDEVRVRWPDGTEQVVAGVPVDATTTIEQRR
jgi:hypothetical protein